MNSFSLKKQGIVHSLVFSGCFLFAIAAVSLDRADAADSAQLVATYGRGVHSYFRGQASQADYLLSQVAEAGSTDPRVFYFRAMARMRMGRTYEAENDMRIGAAFEARNPGLGTTISKSLERVQGSGRRKLERFRREARLNRLGEQRQKTLLRYEQLRNREADVLRKEVDVSLEQLSGPGLPAPRNDSTPALKLAPSKEPVAEDPFGGDSLFEDPAPQEPDPSEDPFGESETEETESSDNFFEEETEAVDPEDPFAAAPANNSLPEAGGLGEADKVKPDKLVGVFSRVAESLMPWRGVEMPAVPGASFGADEFAATDDIELGPFEDDPEVMATAATEDPFADSADAESSEASAEGFEDNEEFDDPFSDF